MSDFVVNKENLLKGGWYIEIAGEKHFEQVQLALFELGVFWCNGSMTAQKREAKYVHKDGPNERGFYWAQEGEERHALQHGRNQNITEVFNAHVEEKQLEKNSSKKPHEMLTPYCRVQWLDGSIGVCHGKIPGEDQYLFTYRTNYGGYAHSQITVEDLSSDSRSIGLSHIYARPFTSLDEASNEELIDPSKRGELVWQRDMVNPVEKQLKQKLAELSEQMKEAQKQLDEYVASKQ